MLVGHLALLDAIKDIILKLPAKFYLLVNRYPQTESLRIRIKNNGDCIMSHVIFLVAVGDLLGNSPISSISGHRFSVFALLWSQRTNWLKKTLTETLLIPGSMSGIWMITEFN